MTRTPLAWILLWTSLTLTAHPAAAEESTDPERIFALGAEALQAQRVKDAIAQFEGLADRGFRHADASYNRGYAYLLRATGTKAQKGDWGQAAAGFAEARQLNPKDREAERALKTVQQEIARMRVRRGKDPVIVQAPFGRAVAGVADESTWATLALLGSLLLGIGMILRRRSSAPARLTGVTSMASGSALLLTFAALTLLARHYRTSTSEGVVIVADAALLNETGDALKATALDAVSTAIPEGASVFLGERSGRLRKVQWGSLNAWIDARAVRVLQR